MDLSNGNFPSERITLERKSDDDQKRSVKSYATRVFQESTIGIVASIASTHSRARQCFKSLLFALCVSGFLYQCSTHLIHVFQYPTVIDVDIQRPDEYTWPAYTFCSNNGIKRSVFCGLYPERCYEPTKQFCSNFFSYCGSNKTLVPKKKFYQVEKTMSYEDILKHGHYLDDNFLDARTEVEGNISGPYIRMKHFSDGAMVCYSLRSVAGERSLAMQKGRHEDHFGMTPDDKLVFYIEEDEVFIPGSRPGILFSIHSPYEAVNPFLKGIFLKPGRSYRIYVTMIQEVLLEEPFSTNCINYETIWEDNNRTGPRIQEMCKQHCLLEFCLNCYGCVAPFLLYPTNAPICNGSGNYEPCDQIEELLPIMKECINSCRDDCTVTKYTPEIMERYEVDYDEEGDSLDDYQRYIKVEIYLEDAEIMTLKHSPKYLSVEVFSAIGGFIGCWLGISLMDIIDVLGSIFTISNYAWRKSVKK